MRRAADARPRACTAALPARSNLAYTHAGDVNAGGNARDATGDATDDGSSCDSSSDEAAELRRARATTAAAAADSPVKRQALRLAPRRQGRHVETGGDDSDQTPRPRRPNWLRRIASAVSPDPASRRSPGQVRDDRRSSPERWNWKDRARMAGVGLLNIATGEIDLGQGERAYGTGAERAHGRGRSGADGRTQRPHLHSDRDSQRLSQSSRDRDSHRPSWERYSHQNSRKYIYYESPRHDETVNFGAIEARRRQKEARALGREYKVNVDGKVSDKLAGMHGRLGDKRWNRMMRVLDYGPWSSPGV